MIKLRRERSPFSGTAWAPVADRLTPEAQQALIDRAWAIHTEEVPLFVDDLLKTTEGPITEQDIISTFERTAALRTQRIVERVFSPRPQRSRSKRK